RATPPPPARSAGTESCRASVPRWTVPSRVLLLAPLRAVAAAVADRVFNRRARSFKARPRHGPLVEERALDPQRGRRLRQASAPQSRFRSGSAGGLHDDAGQSWCRLSRLPQLSASTASMPPYSLLARYL